MKSLNFTIKSLFFCLYITGVFSQNGYAYEWTSIKIDSLVNIDELNVCVNNSNVGYFVYRNTDSHQLKVAKYNGTYFDFTVVDEDVWDGNNVMAFKPDGNPAILYYAGSVADYEISYASFDGTVWTTEEIGVSTGSGIGGANLDFDDAGNPHVCFQKYGSSHWQTNYAYRDGSTWNIEILAENEGNQSSLVIGDDGTVHIAYVNWDGMIKYASKSTGGNWVINEVTGGDVENIPSIKLNGAGYPVIGYYNDQKVKLAVYDGTTWTTIEITNAQFGAGELVSMDLDNNDNAHFTLYSTYTLKYAFYDGSNTTVTDIEQFISVDYNPKIAAGTNGSVHLVDVNKYFYLGPVTNINKPTFNQPEISVGPNPFINTLKISIENPSDLNPEITIYNSIGQVVKKAIAQSNNYNWNGTNNNNNEVENGLYFIVFELNKNRQTCKIIKQ
ncbi:T9SS type A sorting domain-containing protein [Bacteroidota bacterium]